MESDARACGPQSRAALAEVDRLLCLAEEALHNLKRAPVGSEGRRPAEQQLLGSLEALSLRVEALSGCSPEFREVLAAGIREDAFRASRVRVILEAVETMEVQRRSAASQRAPELDAAEPCFERGVSPGCEAAAGWSSDGVARGTLTMMERAPSDSERESGVRAVHCDANFMLDAGVVRSNVTLHQASAPGLIGRCVDLCATIDEQLEELRRPETSSQVPSSLSMVYDGDWSNLAEREVRIEVLSASSLANPEYRFGDLTSNFLGGSDSRLSNVYVEVRVGQHVSTTCTASAGPDRRVDFSGERMLFSYSCESVLVVSVRDKRGLQAAIRGDPLVGEGQLPLRELPWDLDQQLREVTLMRGRQQTGVVSLRFQMLSLAGGVVVPPHGAAAPAPRPGTGTGETRGRRESSQEFVTPPESPR